MLAVSKLTDLRSESTKYASDAIYKAILMVNKDHHGHVGIIGIGADFKWDSSTTGYVTAAGIIKALKYLDKLKKASFLKYVDLLFWQISELFSFKFINK